MRRAAIIAAATAALLGGAVAVAQTPPLSAKLVACESGPDAADRFAVFSGAMPRLGAASMAMRFDLQQQLPGERFARVRLARWGRWERTAKRGAPGFIFTKRVERLVAPAGYRAVVTFRWYDAQGHVIDTVRRTSPTCRQPGWLPDLYVKRVLPPVDRGPTRVVVANRGRGPAGHFAVEVSRGDVAGHAALAGLPAGEQATVSVGVGRCRPGEAIVALVDSADEVAETHEGDNARTVICPARR